MLAETRLDEIERLVNAQGSATAAELMDRFGASESTIRRDLTRLSQQGRIVKVHGGATATNRTVVSVDQTVGEKLDIRFAEKERIGRYAASLIQPDDFVYIDAGSTTALLAEALTEGGATYVTNSVAIAHILFGKGFRVLMPAGEIKAITGALVGEQTVETLRRFRFTIGFFGTNGATPDAGFTTPEAGEAFVKETALSHTFKPYVLCDVSKFSAVSPVAFADFDAATIITDAAPDELASLPNIVVVPESTADA